jgi:hypothetical protein
MIRCPEGCNVVFSWTGNSSLAGVSTVRGKDLIDVRKKLQAHLWGKHNYPVIASHMKAEELIGKSPAPARPGERGSS